MTSEFDPSSASSSLSASMSSLEAALAPLLSKPWDETLSSLSPLERAKMDVLLAYAINDLVWVYLKMKGRDPADHEVTPELERIRKYYAKIKAVEQPETRTQTIDIPAAQRIIKHSLPSRRSNNGGIVAGPSSSAAISARQQAKRAVAEQFPGEDEGVLDRTGLAGRFRFVATEGEKMVPTSATGPPGRGRGEDDVDMGIEEGDEEEDEDEDGDEEDEDEHEDEHDDGESDEGEEDDDDDDDDGMEVEEQPSEADAVDLLKEVDRDIARGRAGAPAAVSASASAKSKRRRAEDM